MGVRARSSAGSARTWTTTAIRMGATIPQAANTRHNSQKGPGKIPGPFCADDPGLTRALDSIRPAVVETFMASSDYHFITHWHVQGTLEEVARIIADAPDLTRWWPSVYLDVEELDPGDASGL